MPTNNLEANFAIDKQTKQKNKKNKNFAQNYAAINHHCVGTSPITTAESLGTATYTELHNFATTTNHSMGLTAEKQLRAHVLCQV